MAPTKKRQYQEEYLEHGFSFIVKNGVQCPQCVICHKVLANDSMKPFQLKMHLQRSHGELAGKGKSFFKLKAQGLKKLKLDGSGAFRQASQAATEASFRAALHIAKNKKPHTIGETLIKPCMIDCAKLLLGEEAANKLKQIPLSNNTIKDRVGSMSDDIKQQVVEKVKASPFFAIQLDESTDVSSISQLMVFVRYLEGNSIQDDLLFCRPLATTTKAGDVMDLISAFFEKEGLEWDKLVGVCTDGAPAMLGSRSGFVTLVKQKNPSVVAIHCMIHREALVSKTLPEPLKSVLKHAIKTVNCIKSSALNTRLFRELCKDADAQHFDLLFHTEVRWLSKGNMLSRYFELRHEVNRLLHDIGKQGLVQPEHETALAYLTDMFEVLNELNRKLQGPNHNMLTHADVIKAFMAKLELWQSNLQSGSTRNFPCLTAVLEIDGPIEESLKGNISEHLGALKAEFVRYFPEIDGDDISASLARDPFKCSVHDVPEDMQDEFIDMTYSSDAKDEFRILEKGEFWAKMRDIYPKISENGLRKLIPFSSTYLCEQAFSALVALKTKNRNKLKDVEADLRCSVSKTEPRIERLTAMKQAQSSH